MEKPRMDGDLHLLMLMRRQLEEARTLGIGDPRLEYREAPSLLTVGVSGVGAVEEVGYGGTHRANELDEAPGEPLRRLSAGGYIELSDDAAGSRSGNIFITDRGVERVRYHQAFESNLPRAFKTWEISPTRGQFRHMRLWRASWERRQITVRNRRVFLGQSEPPITEYLNVDDRFPPGYRAERSNGSKDLFGELRAADGVHELHAHIGLTAPLWKTGCLIAVDGVMIGGDVGKRFLT